MRSLNDVLDKAKRVGAVARPHQKQGIFGLAGFIMKRFTAGGVWFFAMAWTFWKHLATIIDRVLIYTDHT